MHLYSVFLGLLNSNANILIAGNQDCISHCAVSCKRDHVGYKQRIHAFLLAKGIHKTEPEFHVRLEGEGKVLRRWSTGSAIIPIDTQERQCAYSSRESFDLRKKRIEVHVNVSTRPVLTGDEDSPCRENIPCINEYSDSIHKNRAPEGARSMRSQFNNSSPRTRGKPARNQFTSQVVVSSSTNTFFTSVYPSIAAIPKSRPSPLCL